MYRTGKNRRFRKRGFTLVEILIVGALIALFAGIAIFNIQQQFRSNLRKASVAEVRQIITALEWVRNDTGVFPKICYMNHSRSMLYNMYERGGGPARQLPPDLEYMGFNISGLYAWINEKWDGPYFSFAQGRGRMAQGRGGEVKMYLPDSGLIVRWPADPWGNPYVLYQLAYNPRGDEKRFIFSIGEEPDVFRAVVSYGPNEVPGSNQEHLRESPDPNLRTRLEGWRLFTREGVPSGTEAVYRVLRLSEYYTIPELAEQHSKVDSGDPVDNIGIVDPGSDDIFIEF